MADKKPWSERQKDMSRTEIADHLSTRASTEYVFDPETAIPKVHDLVERGLWFTCNDCPLRIFNKKAGRMVQLPG